MWVLFIPDVWLDGGCVLIIQNKKFWVKLKSQVRGDFQKTMTTIRNIFLIWTLFLKSMIVWNSPYLKLWIMCVSRTEVWPQTVCECIVVSRLLPVTCRCRAVEAAADITPPVPTSCICPAFSWYCSQTLLVTQVDAQPVYMWSSLPMITDYRLSQNEAFPLLKCIWKYV